MIVFKMLMCQSKPIVTLLRVALRADFVSVLQNSKEIKAIYEWHINFDNKLISLVLGAATLVGVLIPIFGDVNCYHYFKEHARKNITEKPLLVNYWYPFDRNKFYTGILIDQNIRPTLASVCIAIVSAFVNSIIIFIRLQLKLLQYSFRNFHKLHHEVRSTSHILKILCFKHQQLIKYVEDLNESFRTIIFLEYLVSSISFASQLYRITVGSRPF
ncbi:uncharacterized protein LOC132701371 [Cylas formicarius]|uniref:uncharacterized protein LOC132701371 n=1 Tax=Cylas formicarius TaxID=197179 RepID=UPI002958B6B6|nr:uncharacterized protein LOC132701371 [Cylas formicarius]